MVPGAEVTQLCWAAVLVLHRYTGQKIVLEGNSVVITHLDKPIVQGHINGTDYFILDRATGLVQSTRTHY